MGQFLQFHRIRPDYVLFRVLLTLTPFLLSIHTLAEGVKQLRPDSASAYHTYLNITNQSNRPCFANENCDADHKLYVHIAHPGEKLYMGFNMDGIASVIFKIKLNGSIIETKTVTLSDGFPGFIKYYSQAAAGPNVLGPGGYFPVTFTPAVAGDYSIDFVFTSGDFFYLDLYDFTVIDTTIAPFTPINGRLWSKDWGLYTNSLCKSVIYVLSTDSIVTSVDFNDMVGVVFDVTSTRNGCFPWPAAWDTSCMSQQGNHHYPEYKIFVNNPDSSEYPTGMSGVILGDTVQVLRSCNGGFTFRFVVNKPGNVKLNIEINPEPGIQTEDLTLNSPVVAGINILAWNGKDGLGVSVPCGDSVAISMEYINGLTNIAMFDVEKNLKGYVIELVRPPGLPLASYWDDTLLASLGGQAQLSGCMWAPPDSGCHTWDGSMFWGMGNDNTINTWWYAASNTIDLGRFAMPCIPETPQAIIGPDSVCTSDQPLFTIVPNPLTGSELCGYEWLLTDAGSGITELYSANAGPSIMLDLTGIAPGQKYLKVRGWSAPCGYGPWGPGTNGIPVTVIESPSITNTQHAFQVCSGDTTDIMLLSSLPGTAYSYTVSATSSMVTGQTAGTQNPIRQVILNTGTTLDTVFYSVVPFLSPCPGDTVLFTVSVQPSDSLVLPILSSSNPICEGTPVTLTIDSVSGGPTASYSWKVNGISAGSDSSSFTYIPSDGDHITCTVTSPDFCNPDQSAYGMEVILSVIPKATVSLSLSSFPSPLCEGDSVSVSAIVVNGGSAPAYQWRVNGLPVGMDLPMLSYLPVVGDKINCQVMSNMTCVLDPEAEDSLIIITMPSLNHADTTLCNGVEIFLGGAWQTTAGIYYDTLSPPVNCISVVETYLQFAPMIPLYLGSDTTVCEEPVTLHTYVPGATFQWQDGSTDSILVITDPGEYSVTVTLGNCSRSDSITINPCQVRLWFPDAFTPNGDGLNDYFRPYGVGVERYSMQIFNRWGELVFETVSLQSGWDGTNKGNSCVGDTYVFTATYEGGSGKPYQKHGTFILLR
jgi:gliding motility-associated-like protein